MDDGRMLPIERRASMSLASLYAMRMLGLFLILPVFAVHARGLAGGDDATLVGVALGIYGLTQGVLQLPFGMASDRLGRKPVIIFGLLLFALGSFASALAGSVVAVILGRALQGSGAISASVTAMMADSTRDSQRTKAMALVGASIGGTFALSLIVAPPLYAWIGVPGLFALTGVLALFGIVVVARMVPSAAEVAEAFGPAGAQPGRAAPSGAQPPGVSLRSVLLQPDLVRLNVGIFVLHAVQLSMFVVIPAWLIECGLPLQEHWKIYLPTVLLSFAVMMPPLNWAERHARVRSLFIGSVGLLALLMLLLALKPNGLGPMAILLFLFFAAFNVMEALLPAQISRLAPPTARGTALGVYNTTQSLGLFAGGGLGGWVQAHWGGVTVFIVCCALVAVWLLLALGQRNWAMGTRRAAGVRPDHDSVTAH
jgi:MFS family permease